MICLSRRYALHAVALLLVPLFPVAIHSYGRYDTDDCANVQALLGPVAIEGAEDTRGAWMKRVFSAVQWKEASLPPAGSSAQFKTSVIRSYDPKKLYHHPESGLIQKASLNSRGTESIEINSESIPIQRVYYAAADRATIVAYMLVYGSRPVANPYVAQFTALARQLRRGRMPMTMFFISGTGPLSQETVMEQQAKQWLADSWQQYRAACLN
jgi:hypothetical protein